ncbi:MAG: phosphate regulon sensor histidine kinase PhoR [Gammaproteobacteria bacterium]|nr:phosphate regulon sensor histidine kinase PhoR [Gammaproteobacteria bacterium]
MNARSAWIEEFWRIVVLIGIAWAVGAVFDQVVPLLLAVLLVYTFHNLFNLQRLSNWLGSPDVDNIPIHFGLWGGIYSQIARITARQSQREQRLKNMLNEYASSTSALPDAAVALDSGGRIRWFNDAASRLLGLQTAKDIGQPLLNLFRSPEIALLLKQHDYSSSLQTTAPGRPERRLEVRITPYGEGQILLLARDISERLQQERVRKDFVANVSHELRTPLTVVSGFVENLQADESLSDQRLKRPLALMAQQTARMRQIVEDLLLLARLESDSTADQQQVDMVEMLQLVADEAAAIAEDAPAVELESDSMRRVLGDPKQLRSAVTNLVVNAVHHTPADGTITLRWFDRNGSAVLEIADTGEGIAAEHIARLTERFYRVDAGRSRERGGTGLGLAIVKHVLNRHDARLEIESELGVGSCFRVTFPPSRLVD